MSEQEGYGSDMVPKGVTADELLHLRVPGRRFELVKGRLVVHEPAGMRHGRIAGEIFARLWTHVKERGLGRVFAAETGFKLEADPDTVRAPDVAFVARERLPDPEPDGYAELAPDLVVEVLSAEDRAGAVLKKVGDWLGSGTRLVWVVDPRRQAIRVYRADGSESVVMEDGSLEGEEVLPGFFCPAGSLF